MVVNCREREREREREVGQRRAENLKKARPRLSD